MLDLTLPIDGRVEAAADHQFGGSAMSETFMGYEAQDASLLRPIRARRRGTAPLHYFADALRELPLGTALLYQGWTLKMAGQFTKIAKERPGQSLHSRFDSVKVGRWYWWEREPEVVR